MYYLSNEDIDEEIKELVSDLCVVMHKDAKGMALKFYNELRRHYYLTPSSYIELLSIFKKVYQQRKGKIESDISIYVKGVHTLKDAKEKVDVMKKDIIELTPKL